MATDPASADSRPLEAVLKFYLVDILTGNDLTAEALTDDTSLADQVLHRSAQ